MFARSVIVLLCVLVAMSDGARRPICSKYPGAICPMNYSPLCGTNGVTYANECILCAAIKSSHKNIFILKPG